MGTLHFYLAHADYRNGLLRAGRVYRVDVQMMTFDEAKKGHWELWNWLAETGADIHGKDDWPGWIWNEGKSEDLCGNLCFCCDYVAFNEDGDVYPDCSLCPVSWTEDDEAAVCCEHYTPCTSPTSPYSKWSSGSEETRKKYAAIIRDLPWVKR